MRRNDRREEGPTRQHVISERCAAHAPSRGPILTRPRRRPGRAQGAETASATTRGRYSTAAHAQPTVAIPVPPHASQQPSMFPYSAPLAFSGSRCTSRLPFLRCDVGVAYAHDLLPVLGTIVSCSPRPEGPAPSAGFCSILRHLPTVSLQPP